jgi:hypothetical protein
VFIPLSPELMSSSKRLTAEHTYIADFVIEWRGASKAQYSQEILKVK